MSLTAAAFLAHVLPAEGWLCGFVADTKRHLWAQTPDELARLLLEEDARGHTVYHACASFKEPKRRTAGNVAFLKSLFLDVDCGEGKPYPTVKDAAIGLANLCAAGRLPRPTVVFSGGGLHVYWPLERAITRDEWLPYAAGLKQVCTQLNFRADPVVTTDAARILRPPGTHNRKRNAEVEYLCA